MSISNGVSQLRPPLRDRQPPLQASDADSKPAMPTDTRQPMRIGLWVLGLGLGGFLLWMGFAPLDEGVPVCLRRVLGQQIGQNAQ